MYWSIRCDAERINGVIGERQSIDSLAIYMAISVWPTQWIRNKVAAPKSPVGLLIVITAVEAVIVE